MTATPTTIGHQPPAAPAVRLVPSPELPYGLTDEEFLSLAEQDDDRPRIDANWRAAELAAAYPLDKLGATPLRRRNGGRR